MMKILFSLIAMLVAIASGTHVMAQEAYAVYTPADKTLTFYYDNDRDDKDGVTYDLNRDGFTPQWILDKKDIVKVKFVNSFAQARPLTTYEWFSDLKYLTTIEGIWNLNTSEVRQTAGMFRNCESLTSLDVSGFNTSKVVNMGSMFRNCKGLSSLDVSRFDTSNVTFMGSMFYGCENLKRLNLKNFNTSKLQYIPNMFYNCTGLSNLDVSNFITENVTDMSCAFYGCQMQSLDLSCWNTSNVEKMNMMFAFTALESIDLSSFDTNKVSDFGSMFKMSDKLTTVYAGRGWVVNEDARKNNMFFGCLGLVGGEGTAYTDVYDTSVEDDSHFAHVDGGEDYPGFFTKKNYGLTVSGREVTSMNCDNILGNSSAIYEPRTHTLTLNGGTFGKYRQSGINVSEDFDEDYTLYITVNGKNTFPCDPYYGIVSYRTLWIEGSGSLEGDGVNMVNGDMCVYNCEINMLSIHANPEKYQYFYLWGSNARVSLTYSIYGFYDLSIAEDDGLMILEPEGGYYDRSDRHVKDQYGEEARGVVIGRPGGGTTEIGKAATAQMKNDEGSWYTLDGRRLNGAPTQRGVYIRNGRKIVR